jgi:protein-S-isoprenylcysteine O-methyltransferase Ste14
MNLSFKQMLDMPPNWLLGCLVLAWAQVQVLPGLPPLEVSGWSFVFVGIVFMVLAFRAFRQARTTVVPHQAPARLITHGIFRHSRNPIYFADMMILTGLSLVWGSWLGLILLPGLARVLTKRFIEPEEARLKASFRENYEDWASRTRRWL